jgi:hypothetical protein
MYPTFVFYIPEDDHRVGRNMHAFNVCINWSLYTCVDLLLSLLYILVHANNFSNANNNLQNWVTKNIKTPTQLREPPNDSSRTTDWKALP